MFPPQQQPVKPVELPKAGDNGVPYPPGFAPVAVEYSKGSGKREVSIAEDTVGFSIAITPLVANLFKCISLFIFTGIQFMAIQNLIGIFTSGFGALTTAMSKDKRINSKNILILVASGFGLILFSIWRAMKMGLVGTPAMVEEVAKATPYFLVE